MFAHWGPHFPDAARRTVERPARAATLPLGTVATSGVLDFVTFRARTAGVAGNSVEVTIQATATGPGDVAIDEAGNEVIISVQDNATTLAELAALVNSDSALIEMIGSWNPADIIATGDDEFSNAALTGGVEAQVGRFARFWGPHFPDGGAAADPPIVTPPSPEPAANFAARIEGLRVTFAWDTSVSKFENGAEQRASNLDDPRQTYEGSVLLGAAEALQLRTDLATYAAAGATFGLGLPYEETTVVDVTGAVVTLATATSSLDWAAVGQRVLVVDGASDDVTTEVGVIQEVDTDAVTLDVSLAAGPGARIMPLVQVLLDPQQGFARHRMNVDRWEIKAYAQRFGFPGAAVPGELTLALAGETVTFRARTPGIAVGLSLEVGGPSEIEFAITADSEGNFSLFITVPSSTRLEDLNTAINANGLLFMLGGFDADAVLTSGDEFTLTPFVGAAESSVGEMGKGATIATLGGRALWDRGLENSKTITESLQSMAEIVSVGLGVPSAVSAADVPDWGRTIAYTGKLGDDWQWLKKFLATVGGQWKAFYLPTDRADLTPTSNATSATLTVAAAVGSYSLWAARGYEWLQVKQGSTTSYVQVVSAAPSGTDLVLTVTGDTLLVADVDMISWCELVHLDTDEIDVGFRGGEFTVSLRARVVQS